MMATRGMTPRGNYALDFVTGGSSMPPPVNPLLDPPESGENASGICHEWRAGRCFRENCKFLHK